MDTFKSTCLKDCLFLPDLCTPPPTHNQTLRHNLCLPRDKWCTYQELCRQDLLMGKSIQHYYIHELMQLKDHTNSKGNEARCAILSFENNRKDQRPRHLVVLNFTPGYVANYCFVIALAPFPMHMLLQLCVYAETWTEVGITRCLSSNDRLVEMSR